jgi:hypothetical protein
MVGNLAGNLLLYIEALPLPIPESNLQSVGNGSASVAGNRNLVNCHFDCQKG